MQAHITTSLISWSISAILNITSSRNKPLSWYFAAISLPFDISFSRSGCRSDGLVTTRPTPGVYPRPSALPSPPAPQLKASQSELDARGQGKNSGKAAPGVPRSQGRAAPPPPAQAPQPTLPPQHPPLPAAPSTAATSPHAGIVARGGDCKILPRQAGGVRRHLTGASPAPASPHARTNPLSAPSRNAPSRRPPARPPCPRLTRRPPRPGVPPASPALRCATGRAAAKPESPAPLPGGGGGRRERRGPRPGAASHDSAARRAAWPLRHRRNAPVTGRRWPMAAARVLRGGAGCCCRHRRLLLSFSSSSSSAGSGPAAERGERQESAVNPMGRGGGAAPAAPAGLTRERPRGLPSLRSPEGRAGEASLAAPAGALSVAGRVRPDKSPLFLRILVVYVSSNAPVFVNTARRGTAPLPGGVRGGGEEGGGSEAQGGVKRCHKRSGKLRAVTASSKPGLKATPCACAQGCTEKAALGKTHIPDSSWRGIL